jgi:hypothetical protein
LRSGSIVRARAHRPEHRVPALPWAVERSIRVATFDASAYRASGRPSVFIPFSRDQVISLKNGQFILKQITPQPVKFRLDGRV